MKKDGFERLVFAQVSPDRCQACGTSVSHPTGGRRGNRGRPHRAPFPDESFRWKNRTPLPRDRRQPQVFQSGRFGVSQAHLPGEALVLSRYWNTTIGCMRREVSIVRLRNNA